MIRISMTFNSCYREDSFTACRRTTKQSRTSMAHPSPAGIVAVVREDEANWDRLDK